MHGSIQRIRNSGNENGLYRKSDHNAKFEFLFEFVKSRRQLVYYRHAMDTGIYSITHFNHYRCTHIPSWYKKPKKKKKHFRETLSYSENQAVYKCNEHIDILIHIKHPASLVNCFTSKYQIDLL